MKRQLAAFALVGGAAAATHLLVVASLVEACHWPVLLANAAGFSVAFAVSFGGHARWTFPLAAARRAAARKRFFIVALMGFAANQSAYASGLEAMGERGHVWYLPVLVAVIAGVAGLTFVLSKLWAFAQSE
jgi:putative flippase GtrA